MGERGPEPPLPMFASKKDRIQSLERGDFIFSLMQRCGPPETRAREVSSVVCIIICKTIISNRHVKDKSIANNLGLSSVLSLGAVRVLCQPPRGRGAELANYFQFFYEYEKNFLLLSFSYFTHV